MNESLGTAALYLTVNTDEFEARIKRAGNVAEGLGAQAAAAFQKSDAEAKRATTNLFRYVETLGLAPDKVKLLRAAWQGVDTSVLEVANLRLDQHNKKLQELAATQAFEKQAAAARKMVEDSTGLDRYNKRLADLEHAFREADEAAATKAGQEAFMRQLQQTTLAATKTRAEIYELKAAELGLGQQAAPFIQQLKDQEKALAASAKQFNAYGKSTREVELALRQVPAQMTDIIVSLQGGQAPLTVLLQQGGQLRDLFGGIRPALAALARGFLGLVNPYTVAAAAIGGLLYVENAAEKQMEQITNALIISGNQAGYTAEEVYELARSFDSLEGVSTGKAVDALTRVIGGGKIAADQYEEVVQAALAMQDATGKAVDATVSEFEQLRKNPVQAILDLNEAQHFLTAAQLEQIQTLQEQGDTAAAAAIATRLYADHTIEAADEVREHFGLFRGMFHDLKNSGSEFWDSMLSDLHDFDVSLKNSWSYLKSLKNAFSLGGPATGFALSGMGDGSDATAKPATKTVDSKAAAEFEALHLSNLSKEERQRLEILKIQNLGIAAGKKQTEIDAEIAASKARFAESQKKSHGDHGIGRAETRNVLQDIKDAAAEETNVLQNSRQMLQAQYDAKLLTTQEYYTKSREIMVKGAKIEEQSLLDQIAALKGRNATGKDAIDNERQIGQLETQLSKVRADLATNTAILGVTEDKVNRQRDAALNDYERSLRKQSEALERSFSDSAARLVLSDKEYSKQSQINEIMRQAQEEQEKLTQRKNEDHDFAVNGWERESRAVEENMLRQVRAVEDGYARMSEAQQDWRAGVRAGTQDWIDQASDATSQVRNLTINAYDRMADAVSQFALTGKMDWKGMLRDILSEISKFLAKQAVMQFVKLAVSMFGGGGGSSTYQMSGTTGGNYSTYAAKGWVGDSPTLAAYRNQVVDTPTPFLFAKGAGIFGEAGAEAIMPLTRGPDGNLGVRASMAAGGGASIMVHIETNIDSNGTNTQANSSGDSEAAYRQFSDRMRSIATEQIQREMQPGGTLWKVGVTV